MFTGTLSFGSYRTIVLGPQQPSIEKIATLVFHSTNMTTDGSRLFFWYLSQTFPTGTYIFGTYRTRVSNNFHLKEGNFFASFYNFESRCENTVALLIVGSHVHRGTKIWYLSNYNFRSSRICNQKDGRFVVSFNKLDRRWKQTLYLLVVRKMFSRDMNRRQPCSPRPEYLVPIGR